MKTKGLLFVCIFFYAQASLWAQNYSITFSKSRITVAEALQEIEAQTSLHLAYLQADMPLKKYMQLPQLELSLEELLSQLIKDEPLTYKRRDGQLIFVQKIPSPNHILSGKIKEKNTDLPVTDAQIYIPSLGKGTVSTPNGSYRLSLPPGEYALYIRHLSYHVYCDTLQLKSSLSQDYTLLPRTQEMPTVDVHYDSIDAKLQSPWAHHTRVGTSKNFSVLPYYLGEADVLQRLLLLPGVYSIGQGTSGFSIRGGTPSQNRVLLDGATILNPTHMFGLISVFNPDMLQSADLYTSNYPADYAGNPSSSLIRITQRSGDLHRYHGAFHLGVASGRATLEGPILQKRSSFIASSRISSLLGQAFFNEAFSLGLPSSRANFLDLNLKLQHHFNNYHNLSFSSYYGRDTGIIDDFFSSQWSNSTFSLQSNHNLNNRSTLSTRLIIWRYVHSNHDGGTSVSYQTDNSVDSYQLTTHFLHYLIPSLQVDMGYSGSIIRILSGETHKIIPGVEEKDIQNDLLNNKINGIQNNLFVQLEKDFPSIALTASVMLRLNNFLALGPYRLAEYHRGTAPLPKNLTREVSYTENDLLSAYYLLDPHLYLNYKMGHRASLRLNYTRAHQHLHQIYNTQVPSPTSLWRLTNPHINPLRTDQLSLSLETYFQQLGLQMSLELYNKLTKNLYEYQSSLSPLLHNHIENRLTNNNLSTQGMELAIQGDWSMLEIWLSYTLSQAIQELTSTHTLNYPQVFYSDYDHRHNFAAVGAYHFSKRLYLSSNFMLATGRPYTLPSGQYQFEEISVPYFEQRNQARLPPYHRMDVSCTLLDKNYNRHGNPKRTRGSWTFTLYNLYGRNNVQSVVYRYSTEQEQLQPSNIYVLQNIFPSISYRLIF